MANTNNPVRQRMINMMYLVLTALLAINVSKEVLDGFILVNNGLVDSGQSMHEEMQSNYRGFERSAVNMPGRAMEYWKQAESVRQVSEEVVLYITQMKAKVIAENEGLELKQVLGQDELGQDTVLNMRHVSQLDNIDKITQVLVGSEPTQPKEGAHTAVELHDNLDKFKGLLKTFIKSNSPELVASLDRKFNFEDQVDASGVTQNWEAYNFNEVPIAAGITVLSKIQNDVRQAEADVVKWLYKQVNNDVIVNTVMTPAVISPSNFVVVGDSFHADVFLAAYDDKNPPVVELALEGATIDEDTKEINGPKRVLPVGRDGKAKLSSPAGQVGEYQQHGVIKIQGPEGEERFLFNAKHRVVQPTLVASATKMNVLYRHVDNPVDLSVAGYTADQVQPWVENGTIQRKNGTFVVRPGASGRAKVHVKVVEADGSTRTFNPVEFRVKNLPAPLAYVAGKSGKDSRINKNRLANAKRIYADLPDTDFDVKYEIVSCIIEGKNRAGDVIDIPLANGIFTEKADAYIRSLNNKQRFVVSKVRARVAGTQGPIYQIGGLSLKVIRN